MLCVEKKIVCIFSSYEWIHWQQRAALHQHCDIAQEHQWCQWHCEHQQHWWQSHTQYLIVFIIWQCSFAYPHPLPFHFSQLFYQRLLWHCSSRCNWTPSRGDRGQGQHHDNTAQRHSAAASGPTRQPQYSSQCHWPPCYLSRWHSEYYSGCGQGLGGEHDRLLPTAVRRSDRYWREGCRGGPADFLADCGSVFTTGLLG